MPNPMCPECGQRNMVPEAERHPNFDQHVVHYCGNCGAIVGIT